MSDLQKKPIENVKAFANRSKGCAITWIFSVTNILGGSYIHDGTDNRHFVYLLRLQAYICPEADVSGTVPHHVIISGCIFFEISFRQAEETM